MDGFLRRLAARWSLVLLSLGALAPTAAGAAAGDPLGPEFTLGGTGTYFEWLRAMRWSDDGQLLAVVTPHGGDPTELRRIGADGQDLFTKIVDSGCEYALDGAGGVVRTTVVQDGQGIAPLAQVYWPDGNSRAGPFRMDSFPLKAFGALCPSVAVNARGDFVLGWGKYSDLTLDHVVAPLLDQVMAGPVGGLVQDLNLTPLLALLCCRTPLNLGPSAVYARPYSPDGVPLREPRQLAFSPDLASPMQADGRVIGGVPAMNRSGEFIANWSTNQGELTTSTRFQRFSPSGTGSGLSKTVYSQKRAILWPMALGDDGRVYAFADRYVPQFVAYDRSNRPLGDAVTLDDSGLPGEINGVSLAVDPQGEVLVAWIKRYFGQTTLLARRFSREGMPRAPSFVVSDYIVYGDRPAVVSVSATGVFAVGWSSGAGARVRLYQGR
ncbi:hypothetical protein D0B54_20825 [Solimonas sp. K1W22B-7]|uniref:hypothetical protein n=1 Tax=Solimonas sp. K1W22B-7 TaxID=2303331 RepID=UPI000E3353BD|nr:hypothetical protein [Solimonas sp. K1W22B-7]AXQ30973.1 hypothetical protein D0B54_20825 [Solimonas sp. K1W22B-7]